MSNLKKNDAVFEAVCRDVFWALDVVVWRTGDWGVEGIVNQTVRMSGAGAVCGTVSSASWFDPKNPALQDFLRDVGGVQ